MRCCDASACRVIPFADVEAAANLLTNPALDPYGKIPEFKYRAVRVTPGGEEAASAQYGRIAVLKTVADQRFIVAFDALLH